MMKHCFVAIRKFEAFAEREEYVDVWEEISLLGTFLYDFWVTKKIITFLFFFNNQLR